MRMLQNAMIVKGICCISRGEVKEWRQNGERFSRVRASRARFQPQFCFFAVTSVTREEKKRENEKKNSAKRKYGTLDFNVVSLVYECSIRLFVKTLQD